MKNILTDTVFLKNDLLLQKFENNFPSHTFSMKEILSVFDEVKLAVNEVKISNRLTYLRRKLMKFYYTRGTLKVLLIGMFEAC